METPTAEAPIDHAVLLAQAEIELEAVDDALRRLDDGSYGICAHCRSALPAEQLAADPLALACAPDCGR